MDNPHRKIYYSAIFYDPAWDIESDSEFRGALKVRPFDSDIPENQLCIWLEKVGCEHCHFQAWWWELSSSESPPKVGWEFDLGDSLRCKIKRVWEGQDLYVVLKVTEKPQPPIQPVFVTIRGKQYKK